MKSSTDEESKQTSPILIDEYVGDHIKEEISDKESDDERSLDEEDTPPATQSQRSGESEFTLSWLCSRLKSETKKVILVYYNTYKVRLLYTCTVSIVLLFRYRKHILFN